MIYTIHNDKLICKISSEGAEIRSLVDKNSGREYIWQIDPEIWGSTSPVLFPAIGKIKSGKIEYLDQTYDMPKHGIIRYNTDLKFMHYNNDHCSFKLENSHKTLKRYPFKFFFEVDYKLIENRLVMTYFIKNKDNIDMYFNCGGHTAYACPLNGNIRLSDYVIEFPKTVNLKAATLGKTGYLSNKMRDIKTDGNLLSLSKTLFDEDALIFKGLDVDWVRLRHRDAQKGVMVKFKDYPNLALWAKPGADYVCIEPWLGLPDHENESVDITQKTTYKQLPPKSGMSIAIETLVE
jgi:galactose mutarotase-like enzyme